MKPLGAITTSRPTFYYISIEKNFIPYFYFSFIYSFFERNLLYQPTCRPPLLNIIDTLNLWLYSIGFHSNNRIWQWRRGIKIRRSLLLSHIFFIIYGRSSRWASSGITMNIYYLIMKVILVHYLPTQKNNIIRHA